MSSLVMVALLQAAAACGPGQAQACPTTFDSVAARAEKAKQAGREADALQLYSEALRLRPGWADGWWNTGAIHYGRDEFAAARDSLRKLVAIDPKAVAGYALLGISEYKTGEYDAALEHLDKARTLGMPNRAPLGDSAYYYLALLLNRQGLHDAAAGFLLSSEEKKISSPAVMLAIGLTGLRWRKLPEELTAPEKDLALQLGRAMSGPETEGAAKLEELLKLYPNQPNLHYIHGMILLHGDSDLALQEFEKELARDPRHVPSLLAVIREMERRSEFEKAREYAERAIAAEPENFAAHAILGRVLASMGNVQEGVRELEKARSLETGSPEVYFALASAYAKLGRTEDAEKARAEFLKLRAAKGPEE